MRRRRAIGPDGAAYFTHSHTPQIFRVGDENGDWQVSTWADATGTITRQEGLNLGGIVVSPNRRALVVAQGNAGVPVVHGSRLTVIRNLSRVLTTPRLDPDARTADLLGVTPTDPTRVFTTGKEARGRLLLVDSELDEQVAAPP